jgi:hypothetical protein
LDDTDIDEEFTLEEAENIQVETAIRGRALPTGQNKAIYHNPNTGQELVLPADQFSDEHYTKRHRLQHESKNEDGTLNKDAFGVRLVRGPAPPELKAKWEAGENRYVDSDTSKLDQRDQDTKDLTDMVKLLSQQVADLQKQLSGETSYDAYGIIEEEEEKEPEYELDTQIPMF